MTGHFVTACGCEKYIRLALREVSEYYRIPIAYPGAMPGQLPDMGRRTEHSYRKFILESLDMKHAMAEYREVL
jgi:hypothetical protein